MNRGATIKEVCLLFLKLGATCFGGPAAHIAIIEKEVVVKRQWMSREHFLDLMGATNLMPGPNSTEMAIYCGYNRAGIIGLWLAGFCFILPSFLLTVIIGWFYKQYGNLPAIEPFFFGIKPVVVAIILDAVLKFGKKALKNWQIGVIGLAVLIAALLNTPAILLLLFAGILGMFWLAGTKENMRTIFPFTLLQAGNMLPSYSTTKMFFVFLKIGSLLFGSGYVLFAYLDGDLVQQLHWLSTQQLMDAIAVGQFTPGPVLSTATFIGYQINGAKGALASTIGIFLPSFIFVWILGPLIPKLRKSPLTSIFLDSVTIASVALMLAVTIQMGFTTLTNWKVWFIAFAAFTCLWQFKKTNTFWIILGGAIVGYLL